MALTVIETLVFDESDAPKGYTHTEAIAWAAGINKGMSLSQHKIEFLTKQLELANGVDKS